MTDGSPERKTSCGEPVQESLLAGTSDSVLIVSWWCASEGLSGMSARGHARPLAVMIVPKALAQSSVGPQDATSCLRVAAFSAPIRLAYELRPGVC